MTIFNFKVAATDEVITYTLCDLSNQVDYKQFRTDLKQAFNSTANNLISECPGIYIGILDWAKEAVDHMLKLGYVKVEQIDLSLVGSNIIRDDPAQLFALQHVANTESISQIIHHNIVITDGEKSLNKFDFTKFNQDQSTSNDHDDLDSVSHYGV